jgi:integrase
METLREAFKARYPNYSDSILNRFEKITHEKATWENMTKVNLDKFANGMLRQTARSSAKTYCSMLKSVLNLYSDEIELPRGFNEILTIKKDVSQHVYLTEDEVQKIILYDPKNDTERAIRNQFALGCLTGARHSDYIMFTEENIFGNTLRYVSKKTRIQADIPAAPAVKRIIKENQAYGFVGLEYTLSYFNRIIRDICKNVGITEPIKLYQGGKYVEGEKWTFVSSHTARRTAATLLYLKGIDVYQISKLLGHSAIEQTERYICVSLMENNPQLKEFYSNFK